MRERTRKFVSERYIAFLGDGVRRCGLLLLHTAERVMQWDGVLAVLCRCVVLLGDGVRQ